MSYKGKSALAAAISIAMVYGAYFWEAWAAPSTSSLVVLSRMALTVFLHAVILGILQATLAVAVGHDPAMQDERDALIAARCARNAYYTVLCCLWVVPILALSGAPAALTANAALGIIVLAELVNFGGRAAYDWRGA